MKKILPIFLLSLCNTGFANTTQIQVSSTALPTGMSQERYQQLSTHYHQQRREQLIEQKRQIEDQQNKYIQKYKQKIYQAWRVPMGSKGQTAIARVTLTKTGAVSSVVVYASNADLKASVEHAVRSAAPYEMPSDPDVLRLVRSFTSTLRVE